MVDIDYSTNNASTVINAAAGPIPPVTPAAPTKNSLVLLPLTRRTTVEVSTYQSRRTHNNH